MPTTTGYGGPNGFFTNIIDAFDLTGTVNFVIPIAADGGFDWFALEEPRSDASFDVTGVNATPLPAALPLFAGGLGVMGLVARRRKKRKNA